MEWLSRFSRWLLGVKWNRSKALAEMERMVKLEEDNAAFLSDLAYQGAVKRIAEVPAADRSQAAKIADDLLVRLAFIQMAKRNSIAAAREEFESLDRKMSKLSRNVFCRWLGGSDE